MTAGLLSARGLSLSFGELAVLDGIDLQARPGQVLSVLGPSGCGKSTLLRLLAGFETPTSGEVLLDGEVVRAPSPARGMVAQSGGLFPWLSLADNLAYGPRALGRSTAQVRETVADLLRATGLEGFSGALPRALSGGMRQRAAIAQVMANRPPVLLLDEPFDGVDPLGVDVTLEIIAQARAGGAAVLVSTHLLPLAVEACDEAVVLRGGVVVAAAPTTELAGDGGRDRYRSLIA